MSQKVKMSEQQIEQFAYAIKDMVRPYILQNRDKYIAWLKENYSEDEVNEEINRLEGLT